jgi:hypothetical protein
MPLSRRGRARRALSALTAVSVLWLLAAQSPHLVHHVFEPDLVQDDCPLAWGADRTDLGTACAGGDAPVHLVAAHAATAPPAPVVDPAHAPSLARAPPRLAV